MHREGSMHESRPEQQQQRKLFGTEWYHGVGFKDYILRSIFFSRKHFPSSIRVIVLVLVRRMVI